MDDSVILALAGIAAAAVLVLALAAITRPRSSRTADGPETPFGTSTEGMKVCPECGMANGWTETTCSACGTHLRG